MLVAYINVKLYAVLNVLLYFEIKIENCNMIFSRKMCLAKDHSCFHESCLFLQCTICWGLLKKKPKCKEML